ncbi:hypothetical protein Hanom_Chr15g01380751 [Helianthus anomalus]
MKQCRESLLLRKITGSPKHDNRKAPGFRHKLTHRLILDRSSLFTRPLTQSHLRKF